MGFAGWWFYPMFGVRGHKNSYAKSLERAIVSFTNEYEGRWPVGYGSGADTLLESSPDNDLIRILSGKQPDENPRHIDFLGDTKQAKPLGRDGRLRGGLVWENDRWSLVDAWGNHFRILMDTDMDGELANPDVKHAGNKLQLRAKVLVWSAGEDGDFDTWEDNVKTWD